MENSDFRIYAKYYDQIYLNMKDYEKEANVIKRILKQFEQKKSKTILDVGCGTGEHLKYLSRHSQCFGIDVNRDMIEIAKNKAPEVKFKVGNMIDFRLKEKFDAIICLFSSIGYVQTLDDLVKTLRNFNEHLNERGLVIVEPWVFKEDFKEGFMGLHTYEDGEVKFVRMATSEIKGSRWTIFMHYLVGKRGEIKYFKEIHKMLASDYEEYTRAFKSAGFNIVSYLTNDLWNGCRGLFVASI